MLSSLNAIFFSFFAIVISGIALIIFLMILGGMSLFRKRVKHKLIVFAATILATTLSLFSWAIYSHERNLDVSEEFIKHGKLPEGGWGTQLVDVSVEGASEKYDRISMFGAGTFGRGIIGYKGESIVSRFYIPEKPMLGYAVNDKWSYIREMARGQDYNSLDYSKPAKSDIEDVERMIGLFKDIIEKDQGLSEEKFRARHGLSYDQVQRSLGFTCRYLEAIKEKVK